MAAPGIWKFRTWKPSILRLQPLNFGGVDPHSVIRPGKFDEKDDIKKCWALEKWISGLKYGVIFGTYVKFLGCSSVALPLGLVIIQMAMISK